LTSVWVGAFLQYVLVGWLPAILIAASYSPAQAGTLHGVMELAAAALGFVLGPLVAASGTRPASPPQCRSRPRWASRPCCWRRAAGG